MGEGEGRCGEGWESVLEWGKVKKDVGMWESVGCRGRCEKVCWEMWREVWGVEKCRGRCGKVLKEVCWGFP